MPGQRIRHHHQGPQVPEIRLRGKYENYGGAQGLRQEGSSARGRDWRRKRGHPASHLDQAALISAALVVRARTGPIWGTRGRPLLAAIHNANFDVSYERSVRRSPTL